MIDFDEQAAAAVALAGRAGNETLTNAELRRVLTKILRAAQDNARTLIPPPPAARRDLTRYNAIRVAIEGAFAETFQIANRLNEEASRAGREQPFPASDPVCFASRAIEAALDAMQPAPPDLLDLLDRMATALSVLAQRARPMADIFD